MSAMISHATILMAKVEDCEGTTENLRDARVAVEKYYKLAMEAEAARKAAEQACNEAEYRLSIAHYQLSIAEYRQSLS